MIKTLPGKFLSDNHSFIGAPCPHVRWCTKDGRGAQVDNAAVTMVQQGIAAADGPIPEMVQRRLTA